MLCSFATWKSHIHRMKCLLLSARIFNHILVVVDKTNTTCDHIKCVLMWLIMTLFLRHRNNRYVYIWLGCNFPSTHQNNHFRLCPAIMGLMTFWLALLKQTRILVIRCTLYYHARFRGYISYLLKGLHNALAGR